MTTEVDKEFYRLAVVEINHRVGASGIGRPFTRKEAYIKLAEFIFLKGVTLGTACKQLGIDRSSLYSRDFHFLRFRELPPTSNQGNKGKKRYDTITKVSLATRLVQGESYQSITVETGIPYATLSKWVIQYKAGLFTLDNAAGFKTK